MTSILEHRKKIKEHLEEIADAIDIGIEKRPATLGFHLVACVMEMLELYLHKLGLISAGKIIKHSWFKRPKPEQKVSPLINRKLPVEFKEKEKIYNLIYALEEQRDSLIYGKSTQAQIKQAVETFQKVKEILLKRLEEIGEKIE